MSFQNHVAPSDATTAASLLSSCTHNEQVPAATVSPQDVDGIRQALSQCLEVIRKRFPNIQMDEEQLAKFLCDSYIVKHIAVRASSLAAKIDDDDDDDGCRRHRTAAHNANTCLHAQNYQTSVTGHAAGTFSGVDGGVMDEQTLQRCTDRALRIWRDTGILDDINKECDRLQHTHLRRLNCWSPPEADQFLLSLRCQAEMKHIEALSTITAETSLPLCVKRSQAKQDKFLESWEGMKLSCDVFEMSDEEMQPMVKGRDIFILLQELRDEPAAGSTFRPLRMQADKIACLTELRNTFCRLSSFYNHVSSLNINSWHAYIDDNYCTFLKKRSAQVSDVLQSDNFKRARRYLQQGAVTDQRAHLWSFVLNERQFYGLKRQQNRHYLALVDDVCKWELLLDHVMMRCIKTTVNNDLQYFIFEDIVYQVMLLFLHDEAVAPRLQAITPLTLIEDWSHPARHCPPCGVIPFTEFAFYITPIAYVRSEVVQVYYTFREMYLNYFQYLHTISSHPHGLVALCATFESIMIAVAPEIMTHLYAIAVEPLRFAYRWIMTAFSGFLPVQELLQLWDRILGFDDLRLLAVMAVGIFLAKKSRLLQAQSLTVVKKTMKNLSDVRVVDVLQDVLFNYDVGCKYADLRHRPGVNK